MPIRDDVVPIKISELEEQGLLGTCIRVRKGQEGTPVYEGCITNLSSEGLAILAYQRFSRGKVRNISTKQVYAVVGSRIGIPTGGDWTLCDIVQ